MNIGQINRKNRPLLLKYANEDCPHLMLTNGVIFLEDEEDALLNSLVEAGLDKILLHVDEGQEEKEVPAEVYRTVFEHMGEPI